MMAYVQPNWDQMKILLGGLFLLFYCSMLQSCASPQRPYEEEERIRKEQYDSLCYAHQLISDSLINVITSLNKQLQNSINWPQKEARWIKEYEDSIQTLKSKLQTTEEELKELYLRNHDLEKQLVAENIRIAELEGQIDSQKMIVAQNQSETYRNMVEQRDFIAGIIPAYKTVDGRNNKALLGKNTLRVKIDRLKFYEEYHLGMNSALALTFRLYHNGAKRSDKTIEIKKNTSANNDFKFSCPEVSEKAKLFFPNSIPNQYTI